MRKYHVIVAESAKQRLREMLTYLRDVKRNPQAVNAVLEDYVETRKRLEELAGTMRLCDDKTLKSLGYRRINFENHRYFLLYRVEDRTVYVDYIFHELEDYRNKLR